jgi:FKBP-type peptidyl-prolyl cis-trans isomerase FkpA
MRKLTLSLIAVLASSVALAAPAVETLPSGVKVQKIRTANGPQPRATDTVKVHYSGTLEDGTEFDSSYARNSPASFPLNQVIPCWTQGVQTMKVGEKAKLVCPSQTAYGIYGVPGKIKPNSTLNFEVELLAIEK